MQSNGSDNVKNNVYSLSGKSMIPFSGKNGIKCVFVAGELSYFIIKTPHSLPRIFCVNTKNKIMKFSSFNALNYENGFIYSDSEVLFCS